MTQFGFVASLAVRFDPEAPMYRFPSMRRLLAAIIASSLASLAFGAPAAATSETKEKLCYVLVQEGASAEGTALYLRKMLLDPARLSRFAPTRFKLKPRFSLETEGSLHGVEAGAPVLVERRGRLALYSLALGIEEKDLPKAQKTIVVEFSLANLARTGDQVQPADRALALAAAKSGLKRGSACVIDMTLSSKGLFRAKVGVSKD